MASLDPAGRTFNAWLLYGARRVVSVPAFVLLTAQLGYAALARDAGLSLGETIVLGLAVWALPSQVVFVGLVGAASLPTIMLAVTLSAVRLMPMVMSWLPLVRGANTSRLALYALSWSVAVTSWVFTVTSVSELPREARLPAYTGFALSLALAGVLTVALGYTLVGELPPSGAAMLVFLTPMYFLLALYGAAKLPSDVAALALGLILGPLAATLVPQADLLVAGLLAGSLAYVIGRVQRRRGA